MDVSAEASTETGASDLGGPRPLGRLGPFFAAIWLFFLASPLTEGLSHFDTVAGQAGTVATLAFAGAYMWVWNRARISRVRLVIQPELRWGLTYLAVLTTLGGIMVATLGGPGIASAVYLAVAAVMVLRVRWAAIVVVVITLGVLAFGAATDDWPGQIGTAFGVMAASVAIFGLRAVMARNIDLIKAHQQNARLAVDSERNRFARDLHDILGHSLTVITVKAELAQRLIDVDPDRARREVADLERLSRDALGDIRRAVQGYRELTLPGELARARAALDAAEIVPRLPQSTDVVPSDLRDLFAWAVREGVTNVIRHSAASTCEIVLTATSAEIRDDGQGPGDGSDGSGLRGLRERAGAAGATVVTRTLSPGFSLQVTTR